MKALLLTFLLMRKSAFLSIYAACLLLMRNGSSILGFLQLTIESRIQYKIQKCTGKKSYYEAASCRLCCLLLLLLSSAFPIVKEILLVLPKLLLFTVLGGSDKKWSLLPHYVVNATPLTWSIITSVSKNTFSFSCISVLVY